MAARMIVGTLGGAVSALAFVKSSPVMANHRDKALTGSFQHEDNEVTSQEAQLIQATHIKSSVNKPRHTDFPEPETPFVAPIATRHLILVRHGQDDGAEDDLARLTVMGREQASLAGKRLSEMDLPFTKIVHNGQRRSSETSNMIASYLPDIRREADKGLKDLKEGESAEDAVEKYLSVAPVKQIGDSYAVVVCDEHMIQRIISRAMNLSSKDQSLKLQLHHASVSMLAVHPDGKVTVRALGDTGYMTKDHFTMTHNP